MVVSAGDASLSYTKGGWINGDEGDGGMDDGCRKGRLTFDMSSLSPSMIDMLRGPLEWRDAGGLMAGVESSTGVRGGVGGKDGE